MFRPSHKKTTGCHKKFKGLVVQRPRYFSIQALLLTGQVTLGKSLSISERQFHHLQNESKTPALLNSQGASMEVMAMIVFVHTSTVVWLLLCLRAMPTHRQSLPSRDFQCKFCHFLAQV